MKGGVTELLGVYLMRVPLCVLIEVCVCVCVSLHELSIFVENTIKE